jgi:thiamine pyrophosphokinase
MTSDGTLTFTVGPDAIAGYNGPALTAQVSVAAGTDAPITSGGTPTLTASTLSPLAEATLHDSLVTLTLTGGRFDDSDLRIEAAVSLSGIAGVTMKDIDRESDTELEIELAFNGNLNADGTLTFTVGAGAIAGYNGPALTAQVSVAAGTDAPITSGGTPTLTASTLSPLAEATLHDSLVTLTLTGGRFDDSDLRIEAAVSLSGIAGVTMKDIDRESDTELEIELAFNGNLNADGTLTFTVGAGAIAGYNGPALTAQVSVAAGTDAPITSGGTPTLTASTLSPLAEATLHDSLVTLTLTGGRFDDSDLHIEAAVSLSGIAGVTMKDIDRESDTELEIELAFNGNLNADGTLTFTVGAGMMAT